MAIATKTAQNSSTLGQNAIEQATRQNSWLFAVYMLVIVVGAMLTFLLWMSGNRVQDAIVADANARIEEAKSTAAGANERSKTLENDNLKLRNDLNAQAGSVAGLQKDASDAKAEQQRVQTDLAMQQEKTATAEKELADLKETIRPRHLTQEQQQALIRLLSGEPTGAVSIVCVMGDGEGKAFATQIDSVLKASGWTVTGGGVTQAAYSGGDPIGFGIVVHSAVAVPPYAVRIQQAFFSIGIPLAGAESTGQPEGTVAIMVGHKHIPAN